MTKVKPKDKPHYVNNREFSEAVMDYAIEARDCREKEKKVPTVPDYIAKCFIRISEGLSHRPNFVRYTYREEMVMDAVENCLRAIGNITLKLLQEQVNLMHLVTSLKYVILLLYVE